MFDVLAEIVSAVADALFGSWWNEQSRLTQGLIWIFLIVVIGGLIFFFFPGILGLETER